MSFNFATDGIRLVRYNGSYFEEENLILNSAGGLDITQTSGTATFSVSAATLSGNLQGDIDQNASDIVSLSGYVNSTFVELAGDTMTGFLTLHADPTASGHAVTKQYVDSAISTAAVAVEDDNVTAVSQATILDFGHALVVTSGGTEADIDVDESEFTTVVFLTGAQTISGDKTFADNVQIDGDLTVQGTTTTINTETLLIEDNIITLNSTVTGTPTNDSGLEVERGSSTNANLLWDESEDYWVAGLSGSEERILLESDLTAINADISTLSGLIDTNASDIADNASDITTLSGLIDTNASDIADNAADIASLSGWVDTNFVEIAGDTMTGFLTLSADPTASGHAANKYYVDQAVAGAAIVVEEDNASPVSGVQTLNFGLGLDVTDDGGGQVSIVVDETELNVVDLTTDQSISGTKTFLEPIILASGAEPASISDTGTEGEIRWANNHIYVCIATDTWRRAALAGF